MNSKSIFVFAISLTLVFYACSGTQDTTTDNSDDQEIYIFDDVTSDDSVAVTESEPITIPEAVEIQVDTVETVVSKENEFIVQLGAFTTEERAKRFVTLNQSKITRKMSIFYSTKVLYWVVQLQPFVTRDEAVDVRTNLWKMETFRDAFIVPEEK